MKLKILFILLLIITQHHLVIAQIGNIIPESRRYDWSNVGLSSTFKDASRILNVKDFGALGDGESDDLEALKSAIEFAQKQDGVTVLYFPPGNYLVSATLRPKRNIIFRGSGVTVGPNRIRDGSQITLQKTTFNTDSSSVFNIHGGIFEDSVSVLDYDSLNNSILIESEIGIQEGDYVLIFNPDARKGMPNNVGALVPVLRVNDNMIQVANNDLDVIWSNKDLADLMVRRVIPAYNVGFEDISLFVANQSVDCNGTSKSPGCRGANVHFSYATNCYLNRVSSSYAVQYHTRVFKSSHIEIKNSYFSNSFMYIPGHGYGTVLTNYTSNSLVENNIYDKTRHSLMVQLGANRNVFAFNFATNNQHIQNSDIQIHGYYPFLNLFEQNYVETMMADDWYCCDDDPNSPRDGAIAENGPFNTLFRNVSTTNSLKIQTSNFQNLLGNETRITNFRFSEELINIYSFMNANPNSIIDHFDYNKSVSTSSLNSLPDVSYYYSEKPSFLSDEYTWPALGPSTTIGQKLTQRIPALDSFCDSKPLACPLGSIDNESSSLNPNSYHLFQNYPNPFNPITQIPIYIPFDSFIELTVFDLLGREVESIYSGLLTSGNYTFQFNASGLSSGIYFYRLSSNNYVNTKNFLLVK